MQCSAEISELLPGILQSGIMRIRAHAWQGETQLCAAEDDHVHNIPELLLNYSTEKLVYYWDVERLEYLKRVRPAHDDERAMLWQRLEREIEALGALAARS